MENIKEKAKNILDKLTDDNILGIKIHGDGLYSITSGSFFVCTGKQGILNYIENLLETINEKYL
jgi:hypothetical protein